jgi:M6 family metalloprotease-like protein
MRLSRACLLAATTLWSAPVSALIVVDGKIVPAWPDQPPRAARVSTAAQMAGPGIGFYPDPKGVVYGLTLLVDFSDASPEFSADEVDAWLNEPGFSEDGLNGSVRDYYFDNSNGKLDFQNQVVGFHRASQPKSYYEGGSGYSRASELVSELIDAFDDEVDFSMFDNDGDGRTEAISIVYAGQAETWGQGLWPHSGGLSQMRDGVRLTRYQMTAMEDRFALYVFVHEVGHMLFGWPDLYGFGNYCVMGNASDQSNPVGINDFYRADQGWIPLIDLSAGTNARFYANVNAGGYRYVNPEREDEAFFWSNVQNTDRWSSLRGKGLVVLHFDGEIRTNDPPNPLSLAVVQADGERELDQTTWPEPGSEQADFYVAGGNAELSASTNPSSAWNDDSASGLRLYDVSASGESMTFAVGTGTPDPGIGGAGGTDGTGGAPLGGRDGSAGTSTSAGRAGASAGGETAGSAGAAVGQAGSISATAGRSGASGVASEGGGGGTALSGGAPGVGGTLAGTGGTASGVAGAPGGGAPSGWGGTFAAAPPPRASEETSCACRVPRAPRLDALWLFGSSLVVMTMLRRRAGRAQAESSG